MKLKSGVFAVLAILLAGVFFVASTTNDESNDRLSVLQNGSVGETVGSVECGYSTELEPVDDFQRFISASDHVLGSKDAEVTFLEFFDPNCPHCRDIHPLMKEMIGEYGDEVAFYILPFVLWPYSVPQVEAMYVAGEQGKYFEMLEGMYARQHGGGLTEEEVRGIASDIGLNADTLIVQVMAGRYNKQILDLRQDLVDHGVGGTPTLVINGRFVDPDSKSPDCIRKLIGDELDAHRN